MVSVIALANEALTAAGLVFIAAGFYSSARFFPRFRAAGTRRGWWIQSLLIALLFAGYALGASGVAETNVGRLEHLLPTLLFLVGAYVYQSVRTATKALAAMEDVSKELDIQVKVRNAQLRESLEKAHLTEQTLSSFFDSSPHFMGIVDVIGEDILHVADNPSAARFFGQTSEVMRNRKASELGVPSHHIAFWINHYRRARDERRPVKFEYEHETGGAKLNFSVTVNYIGVAPSGHDRFSYVVVDVTDEKKALSQLMSSEERLQFAMEGTSDGLWDWHVPTGDVYYSPRWKEMLGYKTDEIASGYETWAKLVHPEDLQVVLQRLQEHLDNRTEYYEAEHRLRTKSGEWKWILTRGKVMKRDPVTGQPVRVVGAHTDISHQKKVELDLRRSENRLKELMEIAPMGIFITDGQGQCAFVNRAWCEITGFTREQALGWGWVQALHPEDRASLFAKWRDAVSANKDFEYGYRFQRPSGETRWVMTKAKDFEGEHGEIEGYVGCVLDVTEIKKAHAVAETAAAAKSQFLATMSHEIRTPMNGIIGMTHLLLESVRGKQNRERLRIIDECGKSLISLIDDILDLSKIEAGRVDVERAPFEVKNAIHDVVQLFAPSTVGRPVKLVFDESGLSQTWVLNDVLRFKQILTNLLSNALKFTEAGEVRVTAQFRIDGNGQPELWVAVQDSGMGIPRDRQGALFKPFSQVDASTTRRFGGTGLGLAICKGLTERMGGQIWFESELGRGTTFHFTISASPATAPVAAAKGPASEVLAKDLESYRNRRLLVVEDNRTNQRVLLGFLTKLGFSADLAENGAQALEAVARHSYDLIFMDCHMPVLDGFEATRLIRQRQGLQGPRIVAVTASAMPEDVRHCLDAGMDLVLAKPVRLEELARALKETEALPSRESAPQASSFLEGSHFNGEEFDRRFAGLEDIGEATLRDFIEEVPGLLAAIDSAVSNADSEALIRAAHSLKGAARNVCADHLAFCAERLERGARGTLSGTKDRSVTDLHRAVEVVVPLLKNRIWPVRAAS